VDESSREEMGAFTAAMHKAIPRAPSKDRVLVISSTGTIPIRMDTIHRD